MSETVTLDNFTVRGLPDRGYTLTAGNVSSFTDGAKELAYEYLIPFLFSSYRTSYKKGKDATDISIAKPNELRVEGVNDDGGLLGFNSRGLKR